MKKKIKKKFIYSYTLSPNAVLQKKDKKKQRRRNKHKKILFS